MKRKRTVASKGLDMALDGAHLETLASLTPTEEQRQGYARELLRRGADALIVAMITGIEVAS